MKKYAAGVDIGGTSIKIGLFESAGTLLETWEIPTRTEENGGYILKDISEAVFAKLSEKGISRLDMEGIGMGVPGPVGADGMVYRCVNLGWDIFNVEQRMASVTGLKVKAGNDANVAALGEMWQGGGQGYRNLVMVTLGTGVGGGVIIDGKIVSGMNGAAGEIGHLPVNDREQEACTCGNKGCLEQYASAAGIVRMAKKYLKSHPDAKTELAAHEVFSAKTIFDLAGKGDRIAYRHVDDVCQLLGKSLASIACVLNPEVFVIGGGVSRAGEILLEGVRKYYKQYAFHAAREAEFETARLGNLAGIYGGVRLILEE